MFAWKVMLSSLLIVPTISLKCKTVYFAQYRVPQMVILDLHP